MCNSRAWHVSLHSRGGATELHGEQESKRNEQNGCICTEGRAGRKNGSREQHDSGCGVGVRTLEVQERGEQFVLRSRVPVSEGVWG